MKTNLELIFTSVTHDSSSSSSSKLELSSADSVTILDLAVANKHSEILSFLISEGLTYQKQNLETFVSKTPFIYISEILNEVLEQDEKAGELMLDLGVNDNERLPSDDRVIGVNVSFINTKILETILRKGLIETSQHPLCQTDLHLKWNKYKNLNLCYLTLYLIYNVLLSSSVIIEKYFSNSDLRFSVLIGNK